MGVKGGQADAGEVVGVARDRSLAVGRQQGERFGEQSIDRPSPIHGPITRQQKTTIHHPPLQIENVHASLGTSG